MNRKDFGAVTILVLFTMLDFACLHSSALVWGQATTTSPEQYILPLEWVGLDRMVKKGGEECGSYFHFTGVPKDPNKFGVLVFAFAPSLYGELRDTNISTMATDKFEVQVVPGVGRQPKVRVLPQLNTPVYPWFHILISPYDLSDAPCLTKHVKVNWH